MGGAIIIEFTSPISPPFSEQKWPRRIQIEAPAGAIFFVAEGMRAPLFAPSFKTEIHALKGHLILRTNQL